MTETVGTYTDAYVTKVSGTVTTFIRQYGMSAVDIAFFDAQETASDAFAGYNNVSMSIVAGSDATGLANDATAYTATINIDGTDYAVSVVGSAAQTITTLVTEINADLPGTECAIDGTDLTVTTTTAGESGSVTITDVDLFSSVTGFVKVDEPIGGGLQGLLQTNNHPNTGQPAWDGWKTAVWTYDTANLDVLIATGTGLADNAASATYVEAEADAVLNTVNAIAAKLSS